MQQASIVLYIIAVSNHMIIHALQDALSTSNALERFQRVNCLSNLKDRVETTRRLE